MPKYWVSFATTNGEDDGSALIEASDKHAAADKVMDQYNAEEILGVEEE